MSDYKFKSKVRAEGGASVPAEAANRVLQTDGSSNIQASSVTSTELGHLSGVSGGLQVQLNTLTNGLADADQDIADLVALSGVAANSVDLGSFTGAIITDDSTIKEALQELETAIETLPDPMEYKGVWNASTNSPALTDGSGNNGDLYQVTVAGTQFTPSISFEVGDKVVYSGATGKYEKWDMTDSVTSVNGQTGVVSLDSDDISEGATNFYYTETRFNSSFSGKDTDDLSEGSTNLYFTNERAQDAVGGMLVDSSSIDFTYTDASGELTAVVLPGGVDHDQLLNYVANEHVDHTTVSIATGANSGLEGGGDISATRNIAVDVMNAPSVSAASGDNVLIADASDSDNLKRVTIQSIIDLAPASAVLSVNGQTGVVVLDTDDIAEGTAQYFTDERAQDAVGGIVASSSKVSLTYNDGTPSIVADIVAASLVNADISASAAIELSKLEALTASRAVQTDASGELVVSAVTSTELGYLAGATSNIQDQLDALPIASAGDLNQTSFATANNQSSAANVTGFAFANASVRSFKAQVSVAIDATADLFEVFELLGVQRGSDWALAVASTGDDSGIVFSITNAGQVQYTSTNVSGFSSGVMKFRAQVTNV
jgi:hypothetical protein